MNERILRGGDRLRCVSRTHRRGGAIHGCFDDLLKLTDCLGDAPKLAFAI